MLSADRACEAAHRAAFRAQQLAHGPIKRLGVAECAIRNTGSRQRLPTARALGSVSVRILVHEITADGITFMPATYAYATTVRRAQGMTLDMVGLRFDRRNPDRGYAYV